MRFPDVRLLSLILLSLALALPSVSTARRSPKCKKLMGKIKRLGVHKRKARDSMSSARKASKHSDKAASLQGDVTSSLGDCNWISVLTSLPELKPVLGSAAGAGVAAVGRAMLVLELGIRGILPDDNLCHVAQRGGKGVPRGGRCFSTQDSGVSRANLQRLARGWCKRLKIGRTSRSAGIELNEIARLFESPGMPPELPTRVVEHWVRMHCPKLQ